MLPITSRLQNQWIALSLDRTKVLLSAKNLTTLYRKIKERRLEENTVVMYVNPLDASYAP